MRQAAAQMFRTVRSRSWCDASVLRALQSYTPVDPGIKHAFGESVRPSRGPTLIASYRSYAKGFGFMGAVFAGSECVIEKGRAQHDIYNSVYAGCATGGALAYRAGPRAMCAGCATFCSVFSAHRQDDGVTRLTSAAMNRPSGQTNESR